MRRLLLTDEIDLVLDDLTQAMGDHFQIYTCQSGHDLLQAVEQYNPDLMVLDLSMQGYDPLHMLQTIKDRNILIIATCFGTTDYLTQLLDSLGIRWLIYKPLRSSVVAARLLALELELDDPPDRAARSAAYDLLMQSGIELHRKAFPLLSESIIYAALHPGCSMVDELYPHVARICGTTTTAADITMRRCIELTFKYKNTYNWKCLFDSTSLAACPSNSAFIKQLAHIIQKQLQNNISL